MNIETNQEYIVKSIFKDAEKKYAFVVKETTYSSYIKPGKTETFYEAIIEYKFEWKIYYIETNPVVFRRRMFEVFELLEKICDSDLVNSLSYKGMKKHVLSSCKQFQVGS